MAYGWQLSQCRYSMCVYKGFRCDTERNRGRQRMCFLPQFLTMTYARFPIMQTPFLTLCLAPRPCIIREGLSSYGCSSWFSFFGGFCEQVWRPCLQNPPPDPSCRETQLTNSQTCRKQNTGESVCFGRRKYIINDFFFCSGLSIQPDGDNSRSTYSTNTCPATAKVVCKRLNRYFS